MPPDATSRFPAQFFDGETAAARPVEVVVGPAALTFTDPAGREFEWGYAGLAAVDRPLAGQALRLRHDRAPGARLVVPAGPAVAAVLAGAPHLKGGVNPRAIGRAAAIVVVSLVALVAVGYAVLQLAPRQLAMIMPDAWRDRLGEHTEVSLVKSARRCEDEAGSLALDRLSDRLVAGLEEPPRFSVRVFDLPVINAFALPGGRVVLTDGLIKAADAPDEVAGVLAHELGHVALRHPEAQMVRMLGIQVVLATVTGGSGGDWFGSLAGLLALLRYSRAAEREADDYAAALMLQARIDPVGLRRFFEKVRKVEGGAGDGQGLLVGILSTHPGLEERIAAIRPLEPGEARAAIGDDEWRALKSICGQPREPEGLERGKPSKASDAGREEASP